MPETYSVGEFADKIGVHYQTVKRWCREGNLDYTKTPGGDRRIPQREVNRFTGNKKPQDNIIIYARVSSHNQKENGDLQRQINQAKKYAKSHGWTILNIYKDIGSGLKENREGLQKMMQKAKEANFGKIIFTYQDRLTRFGYKYLKKYFNQNGVTLQAIKEKTNKSAEEELIQDMIKLVSSFSGKLYGMRSSKKKNITKKIKKEVKNE